MNGADEEVVLPHAEENLIERIFGRREGVGLTELACKLGFHRESLRRAASEGRLPAVKAGGRWLVTRDGLAAYLRANPTRCPRNAWRRGYLADRRAGTPTDSWDDFPEAPTAVYVDDLGGDGGIPF